MEINKQSEFNKLWLAQLLCGQQKSKMLVVSKGRKNKLKRSFLDLKMLSWPLERNKSFNLIFG